MFEKTVISGQFYGIICYLSREHVDIKYAKSTCPVNKEKS